MNKLTFFLCVLLCPILLVQFACTPTNPPKTDTPVVLKETPPVKNDCIDLAKVSDKGCPEIYQPVCGCDQITYPNACEAENKGLKNWVEGVCAKDCIKESEKGNRPCPKIYDPVCGCDQVTYANDCLARNAGVVHWTKGACSDGCFDKTKISKRPCPDIYRPVCGCDGRTYPNKCAAEIRGITRWEEGECSKTGGNGKPNRCIDPAKISLRPCPDIYEPVCGCDFKTYPNECSASVAGLTSWIKGTCEANQKCVDKSNVKTRPCPEEYIPVCGCDGKDYPSPCEAENAGVKKYRKGKCDCVDESKKDPRSPCPDIYKPVCGCNGVTYGNKCRARKAGVTSWVEGPCGE